MKCNTESCPNCGGQAVIHTADNLHGQPYSARAVVMCKHCGLSMVRTGDELGRALRAAVESWNRRV